MAITSFATAPTRAIVFAAAVGLSVGLVTLASPPAIAAVAPAAAVSVQIGGTGIVISTAYPDLAACEVVPYTNCYHFADGTVVGQLVPLQLLDQFLRLLGIAAGGCGTISNLASGSPYVDAIFVGSSVPLVVGAGSCADLAGEVAKHSATLVVPFSTATISPSVVSVEDLSLATATGRSGHQTHP